MNLNKHNVRRENIIASEKATHGVANVETGRLMRGKLECVFEAVAGYGAWLEEKLERKSLECENKNEQIERLEAVVSDLRKRLEAVKV